MTARLEEIVSILDALDIDLPPEIGRLHEISFRMPMFAPPDPYETARRALSDPTVTPDAIWASIREAAVTEVAQRAIADRIHAWTWELNRAAERSLLAAAHDLIPQIAVAFDRVIAVHRTATDTRTVQNCNIQLTAIEDFRRLVDPVYPPVDDDRLRWLAHTDDLDDAPHGLHRLAASSLALRFNSPAQPEVGHPAA